mgnify:FL=1
MQLVARDELCSGCRTCELLCALSKLKENNYKKAALRIRGQFPEPGRYFVVVCDQCGVCAEVCPEGCIEEVNGAYRIDEERCTGCGECVEACPSDAMFTHPSRTAPIKCDACGECVAYCSRKVLAIQE